MTETVKDFIERYYSLLETDCEKFIAFANSLSTHKDELYTVLQAADVDFLNNVVNIPNTAFSYCTMKSINLPSGLKRIGAQAFYACIHLTDVVVPEGTEFISTDAFSRCTSLKQITLPNTLITINDGVFNYCSALEDIYFNGTKNQWYDVIKDSYPFYHSRPTVHCADGDIYD